MIELLQSTGDWGFGTWLGMLTAGTFSATVLLAWTRNYFEYRIDKVNARARLLIVQEDFEGLGLEAREAIIRQLVGRGGE